MQSLTTQQKKRSDLTNPVFIATSFILLFILFIWTTRGLDFTDEMQYYGEIKGLLDSGKLFNTDLFIQQSVYILFYPAFYLYHSIFGYEGFVFFGRLLMSALSIFIYLYSYKKLVELQSSNIVASLTALSLVFAIPYHGVFAPSYNTVSQALWIIFTLNFFDWKRSNLISLGIIPVITFFAHPTSAVTMSLLILGRLLAEREFKQIGRLFLVFLSSIFIALPIIFYFSTLQEYWTSITFSSGYGVGGTFFSTREQPVTLLIVYAMFLSGAFFWRLFARSNLLIITLSCLAIAIILISAGAVGAVSSLRVVCVLSFLNAIAYIWALANVPVDDNRSRQNIHWLVVMLLSFASTLGVTSGNGIGQATGAFMVALPLLLGIAVTYPLNNTYKSNSPFLKIACVGFVFALFLMHWMRYPYREDMWWRTTYPIQSVSEFKFIKTSLDRVRLIDRMQQILGSATQGKRTLIISEYPALYFALNTRPETCMLYMHSLTSDKSEKMLLQCLSKKSPEIIVDIWSDKDIASENSRIKNVMKKYYKHLGFSCIADSIQLNVSNTFYPKLFKFSVCKQEM
ncbi:MAG: hypothetical protein PHR16_09500 [Methylovulum sp.]|nr:hypothetical protein [Methylovulum sp.]